jgi:endoglucanase
MRKTVIGKCIYAHFKRYLSPLTLMLLAVLFSCSKSESEIEPELILANEELILAKSSGTSMLAIKSNVPWTVSSSQTWCTLTPSSGEAGTKQIDVAVTENTTNDNRDAVITITAGSLSKQVKVTQALTNLLVVKKSEFDVSSDGGQITVELQTTAGHTITVNQNWITKSTKSRAVSNVTENFTITSNSDSFSRTGTITFTMAGLTETVTVRQPGKNMTIPADKTGMENDALVLAKKINLGWNLGNTMECTGENVTSSVASGETDWGNPVVTKSLIDAVKAAGFNAIRIPCAWNRYIENSATYKIKDFWLARVKQVVDYCVSNDMYAILNIHWDGGWLEGNPTLDKQVEVNAKQKALWEQISVYFRDYDEHLLFAGTNEVHISSGTPTQNNFNVQMSYNQTFVDAVRSTGGKNAYRNLIIQAFNTNIDQAVSSLKVSTDKVSNRLMVEVHYYDPWQFCGMEKDENWGKYFVFWGAEYKQYATGALEGRTSASNNDDEGYVRTQFAKMKTNFVDKGYPVILGEYAPTRRALTGDALTHHLDSRGYYLKYVTEQAKNCGIIPFYWDNGGITGSSSGIFNRTTNEVFDTKALNGLVQGAAAGKYPF